MPTHTHGDRAQTALQKHIEYFDADNDGVISPLDTYRGLRDIDCAIWFCLVSALAIHLPFSYPTLPSFNPTNEKQIFLSFILTLPARLWSYVPDPFLRIYLANISRDMHGSNTQAYDSQGQFEPVKFEEIFEKFSSSPSKDSLTISDTITMWHSQFKLLDFFGPVANAVEWFAAWYVVWPSDGRLKKQDVAAVYDGSIFYKLLDERAVKGKKRKD